MDDQKKKQSQDICRQIWAATIDFAEKTGLPKSCFCLTYFWTSLFYSVRDILEINGLLDEVLKNFVFSVSHLFDIPMHEVEQLAAIKELQKYTFKALSNSKVNALTKEGATDVLELSVLIRFPDGDESEDDLPKPTDTVEYMLAVLHVTKFVSELLSARSVQPKSVDGDPSRIPVAKSAQQVSSTNVRSGHSHFLTCLYVLIPVLVIASLIIITSNFQGRQLNIGSDTTSSRPASATIPLETTTSVLAEYPEPASGHVFEEVFPYECVAPLSIETYGEEGYYFFLDPISFSSSASDDNFAQKYWDISRSKLVFYVRGGDTIEFLVPIGTYELYYATGDTWYGKEHLFGPNTLYQKCDDVFAFTEDSQGYSGWTIQLQPVTYGNLETEIISKSEFPT